MTDTNQPTETADAPPPGDEQPNEAPEPQPATEVDVDVETHDAPGPRGEPPVTMGNDEPE